MRAYGYTASIVLYSFGGLAIPRSRGYGFREPGPWGQLLICLAGPASGFLLAAVLGFGLRSLGYTVLFMDGGWRDVVPIAVIPGHHNVMIFLYFVFQICVWWGLMNLLPVFPLDGGQAALQVFRMLHPQDATRQALILSIIVGGLVGFAAIAQWHQFYVGALFIWLTYSNFVSLQSQRSW